MIYANQLRNIAVRIETRFKDLEVENEKLRSLLKELAARNPVEDSDSIDCLMIDRRTRNCLESEDIRTVGAVCSRTESEFLKIPNIGRRSLNMLKDALLYAGRTLK